MAKSLYAKAAKSSDLVDLRDFCNVFFQDVLDEFDCHIFWHLPVTKDPQGPPQELPTSQHAQVIRAGCTVLFAEISATASQAHLITALSQRMLQHIVIPAQRQWESGFVCTRHAGDIACAFFDVHGDGRVELLAECLLDATGRRVVEETVDRCLERFEPRC